jgi:hypothetical protein
MRLICTSEIRKSGADLASTRVQVFHGVVHEGALLPTLLCSLQRYYPNTLPLFKMAESAYSSFCYVLHSLLFIKFISAF